MPAAATAWPKPASCWAWTVTQVVVNVQGDEPLIDPILIRQCAELLLAAAGLRDEHRSTCHRQSGATITTPTSSRWCSTRKAGRCTSAARPIPWLRQAAGQALPTDPPALRHVGLYAYRAAFLRGFPALPGAAVEHTEALEQLRVLWHGQRIAVHVTDAAPGTGVDTPEDLERVRALWR